MAASRFRATLRGLDGEDVLIDVPGQGETRLPLANIHSAKLVLTDRLIAATAPLSSEGADEIEEEQAGPRPSPGNKIEEED